MKRERVILLPNGMLRRSTLGLLAAGSLLSFSSCSREKPAPTEAEKRQHEAWLTLEKQKQELVNGELFNNYHVESLGYYHAAAHDFFPLPYNSRDKEQKFYYVNGAYQDAAGPANVPNSRPSPEALKKVEAYLEQETKNSQGQQQAGYHSNGPGIGSFMMMYWLMRQNRGDSYPQGGSPVDRRAETLERERTAQRQSWDSRSNSSRGGTGVSRSSGSDGDAASKSGSSSSRGGFGRSGGGGFGS